MRPQVGVPLPDSTMPSPECAVPGQILEGGSEDIGDNSLGWVGDCSSERAQRAQPTREGPRGPRLGSLGRPPLAISVLRKESG